MTLNELKEIGEAPHWLLDEGFDTLSRGYLLEGETPRNMYRRVAESVAKHLKKPELADKFYEYIDRNWLCLSTPVASNCGTKRGLPISCYAMHVPDTLQDIYKSFTESAMLTKYGGGIAKSWSSLRQRGALIGGNGVSDGIIPWLKVEDATLQSTSQGGVRRGSGAQYLDINSNEIEEFLEIRRASGDISRRCLSNNFHHAVVVDNGFMRKCKSGDKEARALWEKVLLTRLETGEPYIMFKDTANDTAPPMYKDFDLTITCSNLCSEIFLPVDDHHTFVCCLSSLNLARWDEWKDTDVIETAIWFLDGVMEEFIIKAEFLCGFERSVNFAKKSRALGLGVLGWHTLLQSKLIPFESFQAMQLNNEIFRTIQERATKASQDLAKEYGEVLWTTGHGVRNLNLTAVAPTMSNSLISGGVSQGIEPLVANYYAQKTAKGTFIRKNRQLEALLEEKGHNTFEIWEQINTDSGSVKNLECLSDAEKAVFATAREINQFSIVRQAAQRQKYIDQGQSVNLFFAAPNEITDEERKKLGEYIHKVHWEAWESGLKSLYYLRASAILKGDAVYREETECVSCQG